DVIDVAGILGITAPRIANVEEVVRPHNMPAGSPARAETAICHLHGSNADLVDRIDIPTAMVEPGRRRLPERKHMMIASVDAVHERDELAAAVREPQAEHLMI